MDWYKVSSGMPQDAKLAVVARRAGLRRGEVLALWIALLDHANGASPRGSVKDIDPEEIAATLEFDSAAVETVLKVLRDREIILPEGMLSGWQKSQKLSTHRTRAHRARAVTAHKAAAVETDAARRQRLQGQMNVRHKKLGYTFAEQP